MGIFKVFPVLLVLCIGNASAIYQDLTWVLDVDHISAFPTYNNDKYRFKYSIGFVGDAGGFFLSYNSYSTAEHMGTHIDAPYHFDKDGATMDRVPLENLIGPLVKIDIRERAKQDSDATITVQDLVDWERRNGRIPDGSFIIMSSGWDQYYGNNIQYVGTETLEGEVHSPGFGEETAEWLKKNRNIKGVGVDTISCDPGNAGAVSEEYTFPVHQIILPLQKICVENLRNVDKVPECGAKFSALPIMLKNSTGVQARVFAEWHEGVGYMTNCNGTLNKGTDAFATNAGNGKCVFGLAMTVVVTSIVFMV